MSCLRQRERRQRHSYARRVPGQQTPATAALRRAGIVFGVHEYAPDPRSLRYGEEAAAALQVDPSVLLKTLIATVDQRLVVALVPVSATLDLKALAASVGGKRADLAEPADATRSSGYVLGGISPLGQRRRLPTVLDGSVLNRPLVYVSGGRRGLQLSLDPADLQRATDAVTATIASRG